MLSVSRILEAEVELNWLPPTEPNGEVHYVIYYTPENGTEQSIDIGSNLTHYNLTGLERNRVYTNIAVQAVNSAGTSERTAAGQYRFSCIHTRRGVYVCRPTLMHYIYTAFLLHTVLIERAGKGTVISKFIQKHSNRNDHKL